jgi:tripartite-type tricarboxylate transporter receptor subunit TctC
MAVQRRNLVIAAAAAGLAAPLAAPRPASSRAAEAWPDRPLRLIVPWPPGGSTDIVARAFQPLLQQTLGRPVAVENRPGAAGAAGAQEAARAAPDGATWLLAFDTEATNQTALRLPYRTLEAFAPVTLVATGPLALVAHQFAPYAAYADVVRAARRGPGAVRYATSGVAGLAHVAAVLLQQAGGYRMTHVPYPGGGPAAQDAVAGRVPLLMSNVVAVREPVRSGALRPLGVTARGETRHLPGVLPFAEQGAGGFEALTWWALLGVAGTPGPLLGRMGEAMGRVPGDAGVRARIEERGADVVGSPAEECAAFLAGEIERWGRVIRDNGIRAEG